MRVLVVEDEAALAEAIGRGLRHEGMAVDLASDGAEALDKVAFTRYDVVVLDRDLPRVHGDQVCKTLVKQGSSSRVLMLTASGGVEDRIDGLTMGADDYLPKPFVFQELVARIRSLGRRSAEPLRPILTHGDLTLDPARRVVTRQGRYLSLSNKEFSVLEILMAFPGRVVSAEELLERAWDENADPFTNTVRVTIANLRRKLGEPPLIQTVIGTGYRI